MAKKISISDFFKVTAKNTVQCIIDLTPCIFKEKFYRILYFGSAALGIYPIIKLGIEPKHWIVFTGANFFIIAGMFRTMLQLRHRKINRDLRELFKKDVKVLNSIDIQKNIKELKVLSDVVKKEFTSEKNNNRIIFKKLQSTILAIQKHVSTDEEPIKKYLLRSPVPLNTIMKKKSELSHLLDTNIISITQGKSKKIVLVKTCKENIQNAENMGDRIQFLLNELGFNVTSVTEHGNDSMDIYDIKTTSEFEKINKKCAHMAFRLGVDKNKLYMRQKKDLIQLIISGTSMTYPFIEFIGLKEIKKMTEDMEVPIVIGIDLESGKLVCLDLAKFYHALIMGGTGSGKSCFINVLIQSAMYLTTNISFLMFDFKIVELMQYSTFKNVCYINNYEEAIESIKTLDNEMNERLSLFADVGVKSLKAYNKKVPKEKRKPYLVVVIDEAADLTLESNDNETAEKLNRKLNQIINKARVTGIIIIYAMQRADTTQVSGAVRAQLMTKIGFGTSDESEKRFIGLENLTSLAEGEMKIKYKGKIRTVKCLFIDDMEIETNEVYKLLKDKLAG
jgi:hypothetical protein